MSSSRSGSRRKSLLPAVKLCLSCSYAETSVDRGQLRIFCGKNHSRADKDCADYDDAGTADLLEAIKERIAKVERAYRERFNRISPDCINCVQNCCSTPFLNKTPFYPEDAIYYMLSDQPVPNIPKGIKHCMFFNNGCTLSVDMRPHACIEYKCIYQADDQIDLFGRVINYTTIDLLAVVTRDYVGWRGVYKPEEHLSMQARGLQVGKVYDRFDREWDTEKPIQDLLLIYK